MNRSHIEYRDAPLRSVRVTDAYCENALAREVTYLKLLDPDRLLAGFYETRGLKPKASKYPGWETSEIQGHTLGHYLSALVQGYESTGDAQLLGRVLYIIGELGRCQCDNGFLFASQEFLFDRVENRQPAWVPWYTMHKIFEGLILAYEATRAQSALGIIDRLADWAYGRTSRWDAETRGVVLRVEYGGMNDCLYDAYRITGKATHLEAAHAFDELPLFEEIAKGNDILNDLHANTTIPKFVGAMKRYMTLGDDEGFYLEASRKFWDIVVAHHSYATGGNSEWEHFGKSGVLDAERTNCNCETCNTYNMLKLSKGLFQITGEKKYLDYYENTILNAILPSQNPETGMSMYFQPMATGYFKVFGTPFDKFWCCTGTGMENFTKLNDGIYYEREGDGSVVVARYVSSSFAWESRGLALTQDSSLPDTGRVAFRVIEIPRGGESPRDRGPSTDPVDMASPATIGFRIPDWCEGELSVALNGAPLSVGDEDRASGFVNVKRTWRAGDELELVFGMKVRFSALPDNPGSVAFSYGPVVLSAGLGVDDLEISKTGVDVSIATRNIPIQDYIVLGERSVGEWLGRISENLVRKPGTMEFTLRGTEEDGSLVFAPHYSRYRERYGIYWRLFGAGSDDLRNALKAAEEKSRALELATIDKIPVGNDQYELEHRAKGELTCSDTYNGYKYREAQPGGWFSYELAVDPAAENTILLNLVRLDKPSGGELFVDGQSIKKIGISVAWPPEVFEERVAIPARITRGKSRVTLRLACAGSGSGFRILGLLRVIR